MDDDGDRGDDDEVDSVGGDDDHDVSSVRDRSCVIFTANPPLLLLRNIKLMPVRLQSMFQFYPTLTYLLTNCPK